MPWRAAIAATLCAATVTHASAASDRAGVTTVDYVQFAAAPAAVRAQCQRAADAVGYAVPCPTMLPVGLEPTPGVHGCRFHFVAAAGCGGKLWRGWIFGSSQVEDRYRDAGFQHLVLQGSPRPLTNPVRAIDGPGQSPPRARVKPLGTVNVGGVPMHWYFVPPGLNEGSALQQHLVLVWTQARHTYAYGFHVVDTIADARALDLELARHLVTIQPRPPQANADAGRTTVAGGPRQGRQDCGV